MSIIPLSDSLQGTGEKLERKYDTAFLRMAQSSKQPRGPPRLHGNSKDFINSACLLYIALAGHGPNGQQPQAVSTLPTESKENHYEHCGNRQEEQADSEGGASSLGPGAGSTQSLIDRPDGKLPTMMA